MLRVKKCNWLSLDFYPKDSNGDTVTDLVDASRIVFMIKTNSTDEDTAALVTEALKPYVQGELLFTGDGNPVPAGTLTALPLLAGSLSITDGTETFSDDGAGTLTGTLGGTGTINYVTGGYTAVFNSASGVGVEVTATYRSAESSVVQYNVPRIGRVRVNLLTGQTDLPVGIYYIALQAEFGTSKVETTHGDGKLQIVQDVIR